MTLGVTNDENYKNIADALREVGAGGPDDTFTPSEMAAAVRTLRSSTEWGDISGAIENQTDLMNALAAKASSSHNHDERYYTESEVDTKLAQKAAASHTHDDLYYTETEVNTLLNGKSDTSHTHDGRYYTESEVNTLLNGKSDTSHTHDERYYTESEVNTLLDDKADDTDVEEKYASINLRLSDIEKKLTENIYGVSGVGQSVSNLERIYDSVGMTADVGTTDDNSSVVNDFDDTVVFGGRKKCVGNWSLVDEHAQFIVEAYEDEPGYAEDGSAGDYVAVECPAAYYRRTGSQILISAYPHSGFRPFDIFCVDHNPLNVMDKIYLPAYFLGKNSSGYAVSLADMEHQQGSYMELLNAVRTYKDGALGSLIGLQPAAVNTYHYMMMTVEFAIQNMQSKMYGCAALRSDVNDRVTFTDSTHILTSNYYAARVVGERIAVLDPSVSDINSKAYYATHEIVSVIRCDELGNASSSGTHQLIELRDLGRNYFTYDTTGGTSYKLAARAWLTGMTKEVSTQSGSYINNTNGYYPMKYRGVENVYGNQYWTTADLFNTKETNENSEEYLKWYYLPNPSLMTTPINPSSENVKTSPFVELDLITPHDRYANGYIKSVKYSKNYPDIRIPDETSGGSATTYFADQAYLVNSNAVRSVRFGCPWNNGPYGGPSHFHAYYLPSHGSAYYGAQPYVKQG